MDSSILTAPVPMLPDAGQASGSNAASSAPLRADRPAAKVLDNAPKSDARSFAETLSDQDRPLSSSSIAALRVNSPKLTKESPVLSLVTGQLENLNPQDIPTLVSKNAFLNVALTAEDLTAFMQTPMPLGNILKALGLDSAIAAKAQAAGFDLQDVISPKELLKGLGVDPGRVIAELSLLKQNLPGEGLAPYMKRAAVLRGQAKVDQAPRDGLLDERAGAQDISEFGADKKKGTAAGDIAGSAVVFSPPFVQPPSLPKVATPQTANPAKGGTQQSGVSSFGIGAGIGAGFAAGLTGLQQGVGEIGQAGANAGAGAQDLAALPKSAADSMTAAAAQQQQIANASANSIMSEGASQPRAVTVAKDPYAMLGESMLAARTDVATLSAPMKHAAGSNMMDQLMARQITEGGGPGGLAASANSTKVPMTSAMHESLMPQMSMASTGDSSLSFEQPEKLLEPISAESLPGFKSTATLGASAFAVTGLTGSGAFKDEGLGAGLDDSEDDEHDASPAAVHSLQGQAPEKLFDLGQNAPLGDKLDMSSGSRADAVKKLMDSAQTSIQQSGSTIRVNLGNTDQGPLDVALKVTNGVVDLRVVTDSQDMRNMMNQELPKLRDALTQQNLTLGKVEVGVDSGWAQSFAGNSGQRWNNQATRNWEEMIEQKPRANDTIRDITSIPAPRTFASRSYGIPSFTRDAGRIQVAI